MQSADAARKLDAVGGDQVMAMAILLKVMVGPTR